MRRKIRRANPQSAMRFCGLLRIEVLLLSELDPEYACAIYVARRKEPACIVTGIRAPRQMQRRYLPQHAAVIDQIARAAISFGEYDNPQLDLYGYAALDEAGEPVIKRMGVMR